MPIKLTSTEYKTIAIAVVVAAFSLGVGLKYFSKTFPEASLDLHVNRNDSEPIALKFLAERGVHLVDYRHAAVFDYDDETKVYLERSQGLERMNQLTGGPIRLWLWSHRWFRPQQKEEFRVDVTAAGEVAGYDHEIPEARAGANLDAPAARALAEDFLRQVMKRELSGLEFLESQSNRRPARTDHVFTWKQSNVDLGEGSLRIEVEVDGDEVAGYREFVKVPEQWSRDYAKLRSRNESAQIVDEVFYIFLSLAMMIVLILRLRDHDVPLRMSFGFGMVGAVLFFLGQANTFSTAQFSYPTTDSYSSFLASYFTNSVLSSLGVGAFIFLVVAGAEPVYREGFPGKVSLRRYLSWRGLRTRSFFIANIVGIALTFFFFAYQSLFYLFADKLGAWAPSDIPFTNELNTAIPWTSVLFMGFLPAVTEELQFRAFAIPFLAKWLRSWPLAILLAAFNWGFLHAAYPNQPFYIRGVEVGIGGIVTGLVMMRFGIMATLIWHYSVDALYTAFLLIRSPNHYLMISGAVTGGIMLVPFVVVLVAYLRTGTFEDESALSNLQQGITRPAHAPHAVEASSGLIYQSLSRQRVMLGLVFAAILVAVACIPAYRFGEGLKIKAGIRDATSAADAYLNTQGIDSGSHRRVAWLHDNVDRSAVRYLLERRSLRETDRIYRQAAPMILWEVRYFRPLDIEEHRVYVDATSGQVAGYAHVLDEDSPGASLASDDARILAERAVAEHGYRIADFELQESRGEKRKAREDYTFVWQANPGDPRNVADARYRLQVNVAGDRVVGFSRSFKLPEVWLRDRGRTRLANSILTGLAALLGIIIAVRILLLFVSQLRLTHLPWKKAAGVGAIVAMAMAVSELNRIATLERAYNTSIPLRTFWLEAAIGQLLLPVVIGLACWVLVTFALSLYPQAERLLGRSGTAPWRRDAAIAVLLSLAAGAAFGKISAIVGQRLPAFAPVTVDIAPSGFESWSPALTYFCSAVMAAVPSAAGIAVIISIFRTGWSRRSGWFWAALILGAITLGPTQAHSVSEYLVGWMLGAIGVVLVVGIVGLFFRNNPLAYLAASFSVSVANPIIELFTQPVRFYQWNGLLLAALTLLVLCWMLLPFQSDAKLESSA